LAERLDVLDLIINTLREHERSLDEEIEKLRIIGDELQNLIQQPTIEGESPSGVIEEAEKPIDAQFSLETEAEGDPPEGEFWRRTLRRVLELLEKFEILSISELCRLTGGRRDWITGFLAALEALGILGRRGTRTHKLYHLTEKGLSLLGR